MTTVLTEGLRRARELVSPKASTEALRIVGDVLKESLTPNGLTTAEIYNLASRKTPSPRFRPADIPWTGPPGRPPNPSHPIRSMRYLKKTILPVFKGKGVICTRQITRTPDASPSSSTASQKLFTWIPANPHLLPKLKVPEHPKPAIGAAVGIGEDWSHLNTRRRRAREEKVARDYQTMKEVLKKHGQKGFGF